MGDGLRAEGPRRTSSDLDLALFIGLIFVATVLRMWSLGDPSQFVFDEMYYAPEGCHYATGGVESCQLAQVPIEVHPPLGKWLIGAGIKAFGFTPFGWRALPALAGGLSVGLLFMLARRLGLSVAPAVVAAAVLALDPLHFVQSRVAMLDIFVVTFGLGALLALLKDRDAAAEGGAGRWRPWLLLTGLLGGAAVATKWPGVLLLALAMLLLWRFERARDPRRGLRRAALLAAVYLVAVPVLAYAVTYVGRLPGEGSWAARFAEQQSFMLRTLPAITDSHPYQSPAWSWPLVQRPVAYYFCSSERCDPALPDGTYQEIMATGNPFVWWPAIALVAAAAYRWLKRRDGTAGFVALGFAVTFLPWLLPVSDRSATYLFYLLPAVPFLALAIGWGIERAGGGRRRTGWGRRTGLALAGVLVVGSFAFYFPLLAKRPLEDAAWKARLLVFDDCDTPLGDLEQPATGAGSGSPDGSYLQRRRAIAESPKSGWCWI